MLFRAWGVILMVSIDWNPEPCMPGKSGDAKDHEERKEKLVPQRIAILSGRENLRAVEWAIRTLKT